MLVGNDLGIRGGAPVPNGAARRGFYVLEGESTVMEFKTKKLSAVRDDVAPDGSDVRILLGLERGSMAHFEIGPGQTSRAIFHRTVEEIWYVLQGHGEMWRKQGDRGETVSLEPGVCLTIPVGTRFQFRCLGDEPLAVIGATMPPWPGEQEAQEADGIWPPTT